MTKRRRKAGAASPQPPKRKFGWPVVLGSILLVTALVAILTISPTKRMTPERRVPGTSPATSSHEFQKQGELRFLGTGGAALRTIDIEIARHESERELGLMYRDRMGEDQGMLFIFDSEGPRSFWMKNTILSLDILFVNARSEIVTIHKYTTPYSEESYVSTAPAQYVVEVIAGFTDKHGVRVGDRIAWTAL